jgi:hypothetical protein
MESPGDHKIMVVNIFVNSQEVSVPINFCRTSRENNRISLDIYKPHEVTLPTN